METPITIDGAIYTEQAEGTTKAQEVAKIINRLLLDLVVKCSPLGDPRNYFDIGVIGYSGSGISERVKSVFEGELSNRDIVSLFDLAENPLEYVTEKQIEQGPDGNMIETPTDYPVWIKPYAYDETPMTQAFRLAKQWLAVWLKEGKHSNAFPPIVINITDGETNDSDDLTAAAKELMSLSTDDGRILLFNIQISCKQEVGHGSIIFPETSDKFANNPFATMLYNISSKLPTKIAESARQSGFPDVKDETSRAFSYNADMKTLISFLEIGTRGAAPNSPTQEP